MILLFVHSLSYEIRVLIIFSKTLCLSLALSVEDQCNFMASSSGLNKGRESEKEDNKDTDTDTDASQSIPATYTTPCPSPSPARYSLVCLFSSCFSWVSRFFSTRLDQSCSGAPASTTVSQLPLNEDSNALKGMAAYNSTPAIMKNLPYDVYINHAPDVKDSLATTLSTTLNDKGLRVYLYSQELQFGDSLTKEIEETMRSASLHLAIFSQNYARSPRCLAELSFMLKTGIQIVPIFYHILPEHVRYAKGKFAEAFSLHESKYTPEKLAEWKNALHSVSFNIGHIVNNNNKEDEMELLKKIANSVSKVMKKMPLEVAEHPTGLDEAIKDFEMKIHSGEQAVHIVGLWGMAGSGKTTLAKQFYNNKYKTMEKSSFLLNVRDAASKSELHKKQKELLEDLGLKDVRVDSIEAGKGRIASRLRSVRVLIVVDDVDDVEQLDALLPNKGSLELPDKDSLGRGSLIIVTTRELEVLKSWGISTVYKMKTLDPYHAQQLFCWHAFLLPSPLQGFQSLVKDFLNVCGGLPLSLTVFGTQLYGNPSKEFWKQQLEMSRMLPRNIKERLKASYDALDDEEKEIFLDVACFFIGEEKSMVLNVWDGSRWNGLHSWEILFNKCLVELDDGECIRMHNNLRDLGREIANQQSPYRIWFPCQSIEVYNQAQSIRVRGIASTTVGSRTHGFDEFPQCSRDAGKVIVKTSRGARELTPSSLGLKIFELKGSYYNIDIIGDLSKELLWLRCIDIGQRNLVSFGLLENLRLLELQERGDSQLEELWESESHAPILLRGLIISGCHKFQRFPNSIGCLSHLKKVVVSNASTLKDLPTQFSLLRSLEHLELLCCAELSSLPSNFGNLRNLRHLSLKGCEKLMSLPDSFKELIFLQRLNLNECKNLALGSNVLEEMTQLEYVNLCGCIRLEVLPCDITNQEWLREVDIGGCRMLRELPVNIGQLRKLQVMKIGSEVLTRLPNSLGDLSSLTDLRIESCPQLKCLPESLGRLNLLERFSIAFSGVKSLPKSMRELKNLQRLAIENCPASQLNLGSGLSALSLSNLKWMSLTAIQVSNISISPHSCPLLETLRITDIDNLRKIEVLPTTVKDLDLVRCKSLRSIRGIVGLVNIQRLKIESCPMLNGLPSFAQSVALKKFVLIDCYGVEKIEGLKCCKALEELRAESRWEKEGIIDSLEMLERLRTVKLRANRRSGVEGCIQSIQKWPGEMVVCTRAVRDGASLMSSFDFPALYLVHSLAHQNISSKPKLVGQKPLLINIDAVMVCFVINCTSPRMQFRISSINDEVFSTEVEKGRWFVTGVFTESSRYDDVAEEYMIERDSGEGEVEKGLLVIGEGQRLVETFRSLWLLIAN